MTRPSPRRVQRERVAQCALLALTLLPLPQYVLNAQSASPAKPYGTQVSLRVGAREITGELLAATTDSVWILRERRPVAFARSEIDRTRYRRHNFSGRRALIAGGVVTGVTTAAMAAACSSANAESDNSSTNCGSFLGAWSAVSGLLTLLSAGVASGGQWSTLPLTRWDELTAHARFPQGLPDSFRVSP